MFKKYLEELLLKPKKDQFFFDDKLIILDYEYILLSYLGLSM